MVSKRYKDYPIKKSEKKWNSSKHTIIMNSEKEKKGKLSFFHVVWPFSIVLTLGPLFLCRLPFLKKKTWPQEHYTKQCMDLVYKAGGKSIIMAYLNYYHWLRTRIRIQFVNCIRRRLSCRIQIKKVLDRYIVTSWHNILIIIVIYWFVLFTN